MRIAWKTAYRTFGKVNPKGEMTSIRVLARAETSFGAALSCTVVHCRAVVVHVSNVSACSETQLHVNSMAIQKLKNEPKPWF